MNTNATNDLLWGPNGTQNFGSPNFYDPQLYKWINRGNALVFLASALYGIPSNAMIIYIAWKHESMHNTCNYLLAFNSFVDIIVETNSFVTMYSAFTGQLVNDNRACLFASLPALFGFQISYAVILMIAADRLFSLLFPLIHRNMNVKWYIVTVILMTCTYSGILLYFGYMERSSNGVQLIKCMFMDELIGGYGNWVFWNCLVCCTLAVFCYLAIWMLSRSRMNSNQENAMKRIHKSLMVILAVVLGAWIGAQAIRVQLKFWIFELLNLNKGPSWYSHVVIDVSALLVCFAEASNALILYNCSEEYRRIIGTELRRMIKFSMRGNQSSVIRQNPIHPIENAKRTNQIR